LIFIIFLTFYILLKTRITKLITLSPTQTLYKIIKFGILRNQMVYGDFVRNEELKRKIIKIEFGIEELEFPDKIIVTPLPVEHDFPDGFEERLREIGIEYKWIKSEDRLLKLFKGNLYVKKDNKSGLVIFIGRGLIDFTERIRILCLIENIKEILFIGSAGSLNDNVTTGDINIPKYAIPFEDVSSWYIDISEAIPKADEHLFNKILKLSSNARVNIHSKLHATVPFLYSETKEFLEYLKEIGVATIDMEVSSFYRITNYYGKKALAILRVGDMPLSNYHLLSEEYESWKKGKKEKALEYFFEIMLKFFEII